MDAGQYGDGQFYVQGVTSDGCVVSSDTVNFIKVLVGIQGIYEGFELKVYPNPVHRDVTIHPNFNINKIKSILIYTMSGQVLKEEFFTILKTENSIHIHFSNISATTLIVEINTSETQLREKLIIQ